MNIDELIQIFDNFCHENYLHGNREEKIDGILVNRENALSQYLQEWRVFYEDRECDAVSFCVALNNPEEASKVQVGAQSIIDRDAELARDLQEQEDFEYAKRLAAEMAPPRRASPPRENANFSYIRPKQPIANLNRRGAIRAEELAHMRERGITHYSDVRGDGNCGYYALMYSFLEELAKREKGGEFWSYLDHLDIQMEVPIRDLFINLSSQSDVKNLIANHAQPLVRLFRKLADVSITFLGIRQSYARDHQILDPNNPDKWAHVIELAALSRFLGGKMHLVTQKLEDRYNEGAIDQFSNRNLLNLPQFNLGDVEFPIIYTIGHYQVGHRN